MNHSLQKDRRLRSASNTFAKEGFAWLLVAPVLIYILLVLVYPFLYGVSLSFTDKSIGREAHFNGLSNYIKLLSDASFLKSIRNTFVYTACAVSIKLVVGIFMALILNANIRLKSLSRGLLLVPWAVPTVMAVFTWKWMMADVGGVFNPILMNLGLISSKIQWLSNPVMAMVSVVMVNVWKGSPFIGISVLSGLQTVSSDMYEAATIDGAGAIAQFFYVTLPSVKNVILLAVLVTTIWTFNDFEAIWLMTKGGPIEATNMISTYSYVTGIRNMDLSKALAASVLFMPLMMLLVNLVTGKTLNDD